MFVEIKLNKKIKNKIKISLQFLLVNISDNLVSIRFAIGHCYFRVRLFIYHLMKCLFQLKVVDENKTENQFSLTTN